MRRTRPRHASFALAASAAAAITGAFLIGTAAFASTSVHTTYLWHLEQPIYWPAPNAGGQRYETAWDSIVARSAGAAHPLQDLRGIFGLADRVAAYQGRPRDAVQSMLGLAEAGAQMTFSGGLLENVASLGAAGQLGYDAHWADAFRQARDWRTTGNQRRLDIVQFPFHHPILPLVDADVAKMELALYRQAYVETWGADVSVGFFPPEMAFSEHVIPTLRQAGVDWVVVSNAHLSRACADYPYIPGSGGDNMPAPNQADDQNPAQGRYNRLTIQRGVSPANAVPFSYQPHRARYVDPATGAATTIVVVPAAQSESWQDGYACMSLTPLQALAPFNDPAHPLLVLLAHDGDNDFGGGYSYYRECTPTFVNAAAAAGYTPSTVAQYLSDHPIDPNDIVHVESGAWVNPDGDFGAPSFLKWNWPMTDASGEISPEAGASDDARVWATITAATNVVRTATAMTGDPDIGAVLHPERAGASVTARAWHYLLGSLNSGYLYYGNADDLLLKPVVASNQAVALASEVLATHPGQDELGPTVWLPQHTPDNPGASNYGPTTKYRLVTGTNDVRIWTFIYDVSGVQSATLYVRADADGRNPLADDANETYAGGPGVGPWRPISLVRRPAPTGPLSRSDGRIVPTAIADTYYASIAGLRNTLIDYYVEAMDTKGHTTRSLIQHVYIADAAVSSPAKAAGMKAGR